MPEFLRHSQFRRNTLSDPLITVRENGSLRIDGEIPMVDSEGNALTTPEGKPYSLCRCGGSSRKPFCDGSHKTNGFDGTLAVQEER
jgi:CDGSH-type Zn-finger protein